MKPQFYLRPSGLIALLPAAARSDLVRGLQQLGQYDHVNNITRGFKRRKRALQSADGRKNPEAPMTVQNYVR